MSIQDTSSIGSPLDQIRRDMMKLPPEVFASYLQNPDSTPNGGIAFSLLVGLEAARRQKIEADRKRQEQPDPSRIPTIAEELRAGQMRDMEGVPTYKTGIAASAQPAAAPPAAPAPAPVAAAPAPAPAPAPVAMAGPPVRMAHGGIIAFKEGGDTPFTDVQSESRMVRELEDARSNALSQGDQAAVAAIDARIASLSGGRLSRAVNETPVSEGIAADRQQMPKTSQELFEYATRVGPQAQAYQNAIEEHRKYLQGLKPAALSEDDRAKMFKKYFEENQAISAPIYKKQEELLAEERRNAAQPNLLGNTMIQAGLNIAGSKGNLASIISQAGLGALDYFNKAKQAEAAALSENRKGEMALIRSKIADERGDRTAAQAALDKYQQSLVNAQTFESTKQENLLKAQQASASQESAGQRNVVDELYRAKAAEEARKTREQIAADALAARKEAAAARAATLAAAPKLDPNKAQQIRFIEDRINTIDRALAKIDVTPSFQLTEEQKINKKKLEDDRAQLEKGWGNLVGYVLPTTSSPSAAASSPSSSFAGWSMKPIK